MTNYIDLNKSENIKLPYLHNKDFQTESEGKGWSFSNVYHFSELKNIYLAIKKIGYVNLKTFTEKCIKELKVPFTDTPWDSEGRRILEQVNALKNFKFIDSDCNIIDTTLFEGENIGNEINAADKVIFKDIFFSYFRFKEIMSWFVNPTTNNRQNLIKKTNEDFIKKHSKVLYPFSRYSRFTDSFILELKNNSPIYFIPNEEDESNGGILRFWDVFVKWGQELDLIEKFNLKNLDYQSANNYKSFGCIYFKQDIDETFSVSRYISLNYKGNYINVPKLIFRIAIEFRYSIENIKLAVVKECLNNPDHLSLQRTSEIFIRDTEINFVPIVNNSYVSHILIQ